MYGEFGVGVRDHPNSARYLPPHGSSYMGPFTRVRDAQPLIMGFHGLAGKSGTGRGKIAGWYFTIQETN